MQVLDQARIEELRNLVHSAIEKRRTEIVDFLAEYIRHKSVNPDWEEGGNEKPCMEWMRDQLTSWGIYDKVDYWEVAKDRPNVVAVLNGKGDGKSLMFNGHSDVVPVPKSSLPRWNVDPWGGQVRDGKIWGRGATDMKSGNTATIWATRIIAEEGITLGGSVYDTHSIAEESGKHEIGPDAVIDRGYKADFLINTEATDGKICPVGVGVYFFRLKIIGKPIHTCMRYKVILPQADGREIPGVSAIDKMVKFLTAFQELEREWTHRKKHKLVPLGASNLTATKIIGGEFLAALPENCEVLYNVWTSPEESFEDSVAEIRTFIDNIARNDDWLRDHPPLLEVPAADFPQYWPSYELPVDHPGVVALAESYESALKRESQWGAFTAVADVAWMRKKGQQGVIFGPGSLDMGVHGNNEYVPINQVIDCCKVYADMILRWCGVSEVR